MYLDLYIFLCCTRYENTNNFTLESPMHLHFKPINEKVCKERPMIQKRGLTDALFFSGYSRVRNKHSRTL